MNNSGGVIPEPEVEVLIDGAWTPAYIPAIYTADGGFRVAYFLEFGESCLNLYYDHNSRLILHHVEGISFKSVMMHRLLSKFAPATQERLNLKFQEMQTLGERSSTFRGALRDITGSRGR